MDFVISWVDNNDPVWMEQFRQYKHVECQTTHEAIDDSRFRDWDNLEFWFRGVEQFAPWVDKIHFVTWGHLPSWLNTNHPKLNIVFHRDFIPAEYLPTFNARTIELNLHRIKELSEHYVYFNDDVFLIDSVQKETFFRKGLPCDSGLFFLNTVDGYGPTLMADNSVLTRHFQLKKTVRQKPTNWFNLKYNFTDNLRSLFLILGSGGRWPGFMNFHLAQPGRKQTLAKLWEVEFETMSHSCQAKFRDYSSVNMLVQRYWELASNNFHPVNIMKTGRVFRVHKVDISEILEFINNQIKPIICINDHYRVDGGDDFDMIKESVKASFSKIFPEKSTFEI